MGFLEYERAKNKYVEAQKRFDEVLTEKERLLTRTLPSAIRYDKDVVQSSPTDSPLDDYIIQMEQKELYERIKELRAVLEGRERLLQIAEQELRKSHDKMDIIYLRKYVDRWHPHKISKDLNYSKSQVYRLLSQIQTLIKKDATKCDKKCANI